MHIVIHQSADQHCQSVPVNQWGRSLISTSTYILKTGEPGCDAFQTFCHICIGEFDREDCGVIPNKSIFMSPLTSTGIGWESVEAGIVIGLESAETVKK